MCDSEYIIVAGKSYEWKRYIYRDSTIYDRFGCQNLIHNIYDEVDFNCAVHSANYLAYVYVTRIEDEYLKCLTEIKMFVETNNLP